MVPPIIVFDIDIDFDIELTLRKISNSHNSARGHPIASRLVQG